MADESLTFRAFGTDVSAGRMFGDLGDKADDAGESIHGLGEESKDLDVRLDETRGHLRSLVAEFEKTGDVSLFRDIRKDRSTISLLEGLRKELGGVADSAQEAFGQAVESARSFDVRIEGTRAHLRSLIREFESTANVKLLPQISQDRSTIALLESLRKQLRGDDAEKDGQEAGRNFGKGASKGLFETLGALPSQLKGAAIVGLVAGAAAAAPLVGSAIAGAVVGGVGLGGIAGGIALAAQDDRVRSEASKLGNSLLADLQHAGSPFVGPLLAEFGELGEIGQSFTADLHAGFVQLAPLIKPLVEGVRGFQQNIGPGLATLFEAARPAIRAVANELPEVASALSDMFDTISEDDRATQGLIGMLHAVEFLTRATGDFIGYLEYQYDWLTTNGDKLNDIQDRLGPFGATWGITTAIFADESSNVIDSLHDARTATDDFNTTVVGLSGSMYDVVSSTEAARNALVDFAKTEQDQFDPMANLVHRLQDVKAAQKDYTEAVKDHGRKSPEAKEADLKLAEAIIAANTAAANASGTFNGKLDPALRNTLIAGGMTEAQLRDIQGQFEAAATAGDKFAKVYTAQARLEFTTYRAGERDPGGAAGALRDFVSSSSKKDPGGTGRALGGPVMADRTYRVGENGPEIVTFGANGNVIPADKSKAMLSGASGGSIDVNVMIDPSGARDELAALFLKMLRIDAAFRDSVAGYVGTP
jgi:hypothetical protein